MLTREDIIYDYNQYLLGNGNNSGVSFPTLFRGSKAESQTQLVTILQYVVNNLLQWDVSKIEENLTPDVCRLLKLDKAFDAAGENIVLDLPLRLSEAFPRQIHFNMRAYTENIYKQISKIEEYKNNVSFKRFNRDFFSGVDGIERAQIVMSYVVRQYLGGYTMYERFQWFANTVEAKKWLAGKHLSLLMRVMYDDPLDLYYNLLPRSEQIIYACDYWEFKIRNEVLKREKAEKELERAKAMETAENEKKKKK